MKKEAAIWRLFFLWIFHSEIFSDPDAAFQNVTVEIGSKTGNKIFKKPSYRWPDQGPMKKRASDRHRRPVLTSETTKRNSSKYFSLIADCLITLFLRHPPSKFR
jgi:hypothetical protein